MNEMCRREEEECVPLSFFSSLSLECWVCLFSVVWGRRPTPTETTTSSQRSGRENNNNVASFALECGRPFHWRSWISFLIIIILFWDLIAINRYELTLLNAGSTCSTDLERWESFIQIITGIFFRIFLAGFIWPQLVATKLPSTLSCRINRIIFLSDLLIGANGNRKATRVGQYSSFYPSHPKLRSASYRPTLRIFWLLTINLSFEKKLILFNQYSGCFIIFFLNFYFLSSTGKKW